MEKKSEKKAFWAYVTMFGVLWGGLELTLGTFLHVLHVPKAGLLMTFLSVILLVAQRRVFPKIGSTICVALIAACIKCLSPGGIIIGPVIGILSEAAMIEIGLLISSRSPLTAMLAGSLAICSCQLQSFFKLWVYYGNDFVSALIKMGEKFFEPQGATNLGVLIAVAFVGLLVGIGSFAGLTGWFWGRIACRRLEERLPSEVETTDVAPERTHGDTASTQNGVQPFVRKSKRNPEETAQIIKTRKYLFPVAIFTLIVQFVGGFVSMVTALGIWLFALAIGAYPVIRSMWWPKFWVITLVVSILAGVVLAWEFGGALDVSKAAEAACYMVARGAYVFALITWAARCVRNDEFCAVCNRIGIPQLGNSLVLAYNILPNWLDRFNEMIKQRPSGLFNSWRYLRESAIEILVEASVRAKRM